jgi:hypothetical protein
MPLFLRKNDKEQNLKEQVPQLLPEVSRRTFRDGIDHFIGLAQKVPSEVFFFLNAVPGTSLGRTEGPDQGKEFTDLR